MIKETGPATPSLGQGIDMSGSAALSGVGRYSADQDEITGQQLKFTRKPKVTLKMINRLKMIRAAKKLEMAQKKELLGIIYATPAEDSSI